MNIGTLVFFVAALLAAIIVALKILELYTAEIARHNKRISQHIARINAVRVAAERSRIEEIIEEMKNA